MQSKNRPVGQKRASFIEEARRTQIIESAIETFSELGYANTSLARVAERAGISKSVISYHFAGKTELMEQIVEQVYLDIAQFVLPRTEKETTATGALRANILSVAEYMRDHRAQLLALGEIFNNLRTPEGERRYGVAFSEQVYEGREAIFRRGQQTGEFREFDPRVMSVTVQSAIDGMFGYWVTYPEHDLEAHADELADLFEHATRTERPDEKADR
ncbi:TetR family transcriptional regulator [Nocardiopsis sp. TSRI0078]|uniref:TetR/AcrR family transcriptional regulator n=1 Tax=unclassified Nocardiopsis TaxID=2649073 RepID=UPI000938A2E9|nr:TetR family transcriptional regulator [Nocardiopsis sp. TSRI0078]OKI20425.1 TetR family transcriptional regulator [Nocardiopsis sp. TSRI0078]